MQVDTLRRPSLPGRCSECPLGDQPIVQGFGVAEGICIIGEAPGASEVSRGQPFVGESGRLLRMTLKSLGVDPDEDCYYTNSILCRPAGNATPTNPQVACCKDRLQAELTLVSPKKILTVGAVALGALRTGGAASMPITKWRGRGYWTSFVEGTRLRNVYTVSTYHPSAVLRDPDLFRDFAHDIQKLVEKDEPMGKPNVDIFVPSTEQEAVELLRWVGEAPVVSCDLETTGLNPLQDEIWQIGFGAVYDLKQFRAGGVSVVVPKSFLQSSAVLCEVQAVLSADRPLVFHNASFDLKFLSMLLGEYVRPPRLMDTMLLHYCTDERPSQDPMYSRKLKVLSRLHFDADDYSFDFEDWNKQARPEEKTEELNKYHALDCYYTAGLYNVFVNEMFSESSKLIHLYTDLLQPGLQALTEIEMYGVMVDKPYLDQLQEVTTRSIEGLTAKLQTLAAREGMENFNPASPIQVKELVFNKWKLPKSHTNTRYGSDDSTDKEALQHLTKKATDPEIVQGLKDIIEYRLRTKVKSTYIDGLLKRRDEDGRVRPSFQLTGTATGRLSCRDPNLQNIPVLMGQEIRDAFIPTPGYTFVEADYSQLELRVAAYFSGDKSMRETFAAGRDIHRTVASQMFDKPEDEVTDMERYLAKYVDFGIIYGRGAASLVNGWEMEHLEEIGGKRWTLEQGEHFLRKLMGGFPELSKWMKEISEKTLELYYVETPLGRRRRFPFIPPGMRSSVGRQAVNTPIQGTASDICLRSLIKLHNELPEGAEILFTVHDAIMFEVEDRLLGTVLPQIKHEMENNLPFQTDIPFPVEIKLGPRWGQCSKLKVD